MTIDTGIEIIQDGYSILCYKIEGSENQSYALEYINLLNNNKSVIYCDLEECKSLLEYYNRNKDI